MTEPKRCETCKAPKGYRWTTGNPPKPCPDAFHDTPASEPPPGGFIATPVKHVPGERTEQGTSADTAPETPTVPAYPGFPQEADLRPTGAASNEKWISLIEFNRLLRKWRSKYLTHAESDARVAEANRNRNAYFEPIIAGFRERETEAGFDSAVAKAVREEREQWVLCSDRLPDLLPDTQTGKLYSSAKVFIFVPGLAEGQQVKVTTYMSAWGEEVPAGWSSGGIGGRWPEKFVTHWWDGLVEPLPPAIRSRGADTEKGEGT